MLRGLFEGAQYNSEAGATRTVNSRARTKQGRGEVKEIRCIYIYIYIYIDKNVNESTTVCSLRSLRSLALNNYIHPM